MCAGGRPNPVPQPGPLLPCRKRARPPSPAQLEFICLKSLPHFPATIIKYFVPDLTFTEAAAPGIGEGWGIQAPLSTPTKGVGEFVGLMVLERRSGRETGG